MQNQIFQTHARCLTFVLCLVFITPPAVAQDSQALCDSVLAQTEAAQVIASYAITNMEYDGWRVGPDSSSRFSESHVYTERSDWLSGEELVAFEGSTIRCADGALVVDGSMKTNTQTSERFKEGFEPPLTWLQLPIESGRSWVWSGVYSHNNGERQRQYQVTAYGFVGESKTVETPAGSFLCHPVTTELTFFADTAQTTTRTVSCISIDPHYLVVERTRQIVGFEHGPLQEFRLLSVETAGGGESP